MKHTRKGNVFVIRVDKGEDVMNSLRKFCEEQKMGAGFFTGIGALQYAEIGLFSEEDKRYAMNKIEKPLEIANLTGSVAMAENGLVIHAHATLGDEKGRVYAGHLAKGIVSVTCEIFLTVLEDELKRKEDERTGLKLLDL